MLSVQLTQPWALALLVLLVPVIWLSRHSLSGLGRQRAKLALALRLLVVLSLVLAVAGLQLVRRVKGVAVVYVLDRSESIPEEDQQQALGFIRQAAETMRPDDTGGVVVAARTALLEKVPQPALELNAIDSHPDPSFTDLSSGLRLAIASLPPDAQRRVVLLSDGNENLGDALGEARLSQAAGVRVDVVPLRRSRRGEVAVERLLTPGEARYGDTIEPRVVLQSDTKTQAKLRLLEDNQLVAETSAKLTPGKNVVAFPSLTLETDGFHSYTVELTAAADQDQRNNRGVGFTYVRGRQRVLYVEGDRGMEQYLREALTQAGIAVDTVSSQGLPNNLASLAGYDCLILSNVSSLELSDAQMVQIRSAVRDLGIGFVMIGGDESFGVGGYYKSPLEDALPVDMDIRKQRHLPNVGVAIVIDQSGSMAMTEGGIEKIQLANEAAIAVVSLLGPRDLIAVIPTDSVAKPVHGPKMVTVTQKQALIDEIGAIRAGGGGIYVHTGLVKAAELIRPAPSKLKHIILFADAADSEEQEHCRELARELVKEKITLTVVALGHQEDCDVAFLKEVARLGGGRFYLTAQASNLPRIFTRETILASRSQLIERTFTPLLSRDLEILRGIDALPPLRGYVATTAKPSAEVGLVAEAKFKDPILAVWQYGLGRSVAFTSDCKARWAVDWLGWDGYRKFWSQLVRWTMRRVRRGDFEARVVTRYDADSDEVASYRLRTGEAKVLVDAVDDDGRFLNRLALEGTAVAPDGQGFDLTLRQTAPGRYEGTFPLDQVGVYLVNIGGGEGEHAGSETVGAALAYPPEYRDLESNETLLTRIAETTRGTVLDDPSQVYSRRELTARAPTDVWPLLLTLALALFPFDVALRRVLVDPRKLRAWLAAHRKVRPEAEPERPTERLLDSKQRLSERLRRTPAVKAMEPGPAAAVSAEVKEPSEAPPADEPQERLTQRLRAARAATRARTQREPTTDLPLSTTPTTPAPPTEPREPVDRDAAGSLERLRRAQRRWRGEQSEPENEP